MLIALFYGLESSVPVKYDKNISYARFIKWIFHSHVGFMFVGPIILYELYKIIFSIMIYEDVNGLG